MTTTLERPRGHETFVVRDVHCARCAELVQRTVASIRGVHDVHIDPVFGHTFLDYDPDVITEDDLIGAVEEAGYEIVRTWD